MSPATAFAAIISLAAAAFAARMSGGSLSLNLARLASVSPMMAGKSAGESNAANAASATDRSTAWPSIAMARKSGGIGLLRPGHSKPPDIHGCQEVMVLTVQLIALKKFFRPLSIRSGKLPAS